MKTIIIAGFDNLVFTVADMLNPMEYKLIGYATTMEEAWNIYDETGDVKVDLKEMPIMPIDVAAEFEPDIMILASVDADEDEKLKYMLYRAGHQGEVISLYDFQKGFSLTSSAIRKTVWRLSELGMEGKIAEVGPNRGDYSWQLNALVPDRDFYLFDTGSGRDVSRLLSRMSYPEKVQVRIGAFPENAYDLEDETYSLVYLDTRDYGTVYKGIQYFFPRMHKGGVIIVSGYEDGKTQAVRQAIYNLEQQYGAFLMTPVNDLSGSVMILRP